jgi:cysteine desulfurase
MTPRIYFDNAATTPILPEVIDAMMPYLKEHFGNPSSIYSYGRESRLAIEKSRKSVASILNAHPSEIFFTSGGTESSNTAIWGAVRDLGCQRIITSPIEHHATLHTCDFISKTANIELTFVKLLDNGHVDLDDLEANLSSSPKRALVSIMHANNEIGNISCMETIGKICQKHDAIFHADTVQTVGHYPIDLSRISVDFITGSGHKFHGPKGTGILYINSRNKISPFIHGGGQERNMRAGTENIYGIVGFSKALELATLNHDSDRKHIELLKSYMHASLVDQIDGVRFNGDYNGDSLYAVLSVGFPKTARSEMLLYNLDIRNICISGGSACTSGADQDSHVIEALHKEEQATIRFSFNKFNTRAEIDTVINHLKELI